jgi:hypothetical protein
MKKMTGGEVINFVNANPAYVTTAGVAGCTLQVAGEKIQAANFVFAACMKKLLSGNCECSLCGGRRGRSIISNV